MNLLQFQNILVVMAECSCGDTP